MARRGEAEGETLGERGGGRGVDEILAGRGIGFDGFDGFFGFGGGVTEARGKPGGRRGGEGEGEREEDLGGGRERDEGGGGGGGKRELR